MKMNSESIILHKKGEYKQNFLPLFWTKQTARPCQTYNVVVAQPPDQPALPGSVLPFCGFLPTNLWVSEQFVGAFVGKAILRIFVGKIYGYSLYLWVVLGF